MTVLPLRVLNFFSKKKKHPKIANMITNKMIIHLFHAENKTGWATKI